MLPVLIQNLIKHNKDKYKAIPASKQEAEYHSNKFGTVVLWFIVVMVLIGLLLN